MIHVLTSSSMRNKNVNNDDKTAIIAAPIPSYKYVTINSFIKQKYMPNDTHSLPVLMTMASKVPSREK